MATAALQTSLGVLRLTSLEETIVALDWEESGCTSAPATSLLREACRQLEAYFAGNLKDFDLPLAPAGSDFQQKVWRVLSEITYGQVLTYGAVATRTDGSAQAVGRACGSNPIPILIPCHRVVGTSGKLVGYSGAGGIATKQRLLLHEGALPPELPLFSGID